MKLKCCCVQMASTPFDREDNLARAERYIRRAAAGGARLVVLPEYLASGCVYDSKLRRLAEPRDGATGRLLRRLADEYGCWIAAGVVESDGRATYNSLLLVGPAGEQHWYRKRYPVFLENLYFHAGTAPGVVQTPLGRVGLMICWDMVHGRLLREMRGRIDLLVIASAWPRLSGANLRLWGFRRWSDAQPAGRPERLAKALGVPVVYCNSAGPWETPIPGTPLTLRTTFAGRSSIVDGGGERVALGEAGEGLVVGEVELAPSGARARVSAA